MLTSSGYISVRIINYKSNKMEEFKDKLNEYMEAHGIKGTIEEESTTEDFKAGFYAANGALNIARGSISLRDKLEEFVAKYWYENEYQQIDKQDHAKATESREKFRKWFDDNIEAFLKQ